MIRTLPLLLASLAGLGSAASDATDATMSFTAAARNLPRDVRIDRTGSGIRTGRSPGTRAKRAWKMRRRMGRGRKR